MSKVVEYTRRGWFGVCPVYLTEGECPVIRPRWRLDWLFAVSEWLMQTAIFIKSAGDPEWEPVFPIRITGKLSPPLVIEEEASA